MQSKLINADGTTRYAHAKEWEWTDKGYRGRIAHPVVVTEVGAKRPAGYGRQTQNNGIAITFLDDEGRMTDRTAVVRAQEIRQLWADYEAEAKADDEARAKAAVQKQEAKKALLARWADAQAKLPEGTPLPWFAKEDARYEHGDITLLNLSDIIEAAFAAGYEAGKGES